MRSEEALGNHRDRQRWPLYTDLARAVAFYEQLGFAKVSENERGSTMVCGAAKLFLFQTRQANPQETQRGFDLFDNSPGIDHLSFLVADVDRTYESLEARGVRFDIETGEPAWWRSRILTATICTSCSGTTKDNS